MRNTQQFYTLSGAYIASHFEQHLSIQNGPSPCQSLGQITVQNRLQAVTCFTEGISIAAKRVHTAQQVCYAVVCEQILQKEGQKALQKLPLLFQVSPHVHKDKLCHRGRILYNTATLVSTIHCHIDRSSHQNFSFVHKLVIRSC